MLILVWVGRCSLVVSNPDHSVNKANYFKISYQVYGIIAQSYDTV
jgi:hypothetical protein